MLKADYNSDRFRGVSVTEKSRQEVLKKRSENMKCKKCNKSIKENTEGNLKYCQGHND